MYNYTGVCMHACMHGWMDVCMYVCVCVYVCMCILYIYIYKPISLNVGSIVLVKTSNLLFKTPGRAISSNCPWLTNLLHNTQYAHLCVF